MILWLKHLLVIWRGKGACCICSEPLNSSPRSAQCDDDVCGDCWNKSTEIGDDHS